MANGNGGGNFLKILTICVSVVGMFAIQAINADVRNKERDSVQDDKISTVQADIREIKTAQTYLQKDMDEMRVEQKTGFQEVKQLIAQMQTR